MRPLTRSPPPVRHLPALSRQRPALVRCAVPVLPDFDHASDGVVIDAEPSSAIDSSSPYLDYARVLTTDGGIRLTYRDLDQRLRIFLRSAALWSLFTLAESLLLFNPPPVANGFVGFLCLLAGAGLNWLILGRPFEVYRSIELRPDGLILDDAEIFWLDRMENGWPEFHADADGNQVLSGIYGTRLIDYLTVRRFGDADRTPEVFAMHLQDAMEQLWNAPYEA